MSPSPRKPSHARTPLTPEGSVRLAALHRCALLDTEPVAAAAGGELRVLVVDDNSVNRKVAARMLTKLGCRVTVAATGREAVDMLQRVPHQLVFTDCMLPEMDGYEATAAIRQLAGPRARTPIIAMTANAMPRDRERCLAADLPDCRAAISRACVAKQAGTLRSAAHALKSSAASLGAPRLAELCTAVEAAARCGETTTAARATARMEQEAMSVQWYLQEHCALLSQPR